MKSRLIRALQRGGIVAEIGPDRWGVWRSKDRRGRMIGVLTGAEIDVLRVREALKSLGDGQPPILVWAGFVLETPLVAPSSARLDNDAQGTVAPMIELLLSRSQDVGLRELIRETARRYRADAERASSVGAARGMNWDGLALGGKIDGGRGFSDQGPGGGALTAQSAHEVLRRHLGSETMSLLDRLILSGDSRTQLTKRLGGRPALMERRSLAAIRALHEVYRDKVRRTD